MTPSPSHHHHKADPYGRDLSSSGLAVAAAVLQQTIIELAPGVHVTVRPKEETWTAIRGGRITITTYCDCGREMACVKTSPMVLCKGCQTVSPVNQSGAFVDCSSGVDGGGGNDDPVGIGIKLEDMMAWLAQEAAEEEGEQERASSLAVA